MQMVNIKEILEKNTIGIGINEPLFKGNYFGGAEKPANESIINLTAAHVLSEEMQGKPPTEKRVMELAKANKEVVARIVNDKHDFGAVIETLEKMENADPKTAKMMMAVASIRFEKQMNGEKIPALSTQISTDTSSNNEMRKQAGLASLLSGLYLKMTESMAALDDSSKQLIGSSIPTKTTDEWIKPPTTFDDLLEKSQRVERLQGVMDTRSSEVEVAVKSTMVGKLKKLLSSKTNMSPPKEVRQEYSFRPSSVAGETLRLFEQFAEISGIDVKPSQVADLVFHAGAIPNGLEKMNEELAERNTNFVRLFGSSPDNLDKGIIGKVMNNTPNINIPPQEQFFLRLELIEKYIPLLPDELSQAVGEMSKRAGEVEKLAHFITNNIGEELLEGKKIDVHKMLSQDDYLFPDVLGGKMPDFNQVLAMESEGVYASLLNNFGRLKLDFPELQKNVDFMNAENMVTKPQKIFGDKILLNASSEEIKQASLMPERIAKDLTKLPKDNFSAAIEGAQADDRVMVHLIRGALFPEKEQEIRGNLEKFSEESLEVLRGVLSLTEELSSCEKIYKVTHKFVHKNFPRHEVLKFEKVSRSSVVFMAGARKAAKSAKPWFEKKVLNVSNDAPNINNKVSNVTMLEKLKMRSKGVGG